MAERNSWGSSPSGSQSDLTAGGQSPLPPQVLQTIRQGKEGFSSPYQADSSSRGSLFGQSSGKRIVNTIKELAG